MGTTLSNRSWSSLGAATDVWHEGAQALTALLLDVPTAALVIGPLFVAVMGPGIRFAH